MEKFSFRFGFGGKCFFKLRMNVVFRMSNLWENVQVGFY